MAASKFRHDRQIEAVNELWSEEEEQSSTGRALHALQHRPRDEDSQQVSRRMRTGVSLVIDAPL